MALIFQKIIPNTIKPELAIAGCGSIYTLYAPETTMLHPGLRKWIGTGIRIELPPDTLLQLSRIGYRANIELNGTHFITAGMRAMEISVPLLNKETFHVEIQRGEAIAEFALLQLHPLQPTGGLIERVKEPVEVNPPRGEKRAQAARPRGRPRKQAKTELA